MHFLAGIFYLIYRDEGVSFSMLCSLMEKVNIAGFYQQEASLMQEYTYYLNRLITLFLPNISKYFGEQELNITYFVSIWYLTSFCNPIQYCNDKEMPLLLLSIFDKYLFVIIYNCRMDEMCSCKQDFSF